MVARLARLLCFPTTGRSTCSSLTDASWKEASLDIQVEATTADLEKLKAKDIELWVAVSCGATNVRQVFELPRTKSAAALWRGAIALDRDNYFGKVTLTAVLVGEVAGVARRPLGSSHEWTLHFDPPAVPLVGGALRVEWHNFRSSGAPVLARLYPDAPYVSDSGCHESCDLPELRASHL